MEGGIGQDIESFIHEVTGHVDVKDGLIKAGVGVDVPAGRLNAPGNLADGIGRCPLEDHVLDQVTDPGLFAPLGATPDLAAEVHRHDRGIMTFLEQQGQAVR